MSGNVKSLSNHEAVTELLSLMRENGRKLEAMALSSMISSIDNIDRQYLSPRTVSRSRWGPP